MLIFLISKFLLWDIIRLCCVSVIIVHSILEILPQCYSRPHFVPGPLINPPTPFQVHHFVTASFNMLKVNFIHNQIQHEVGHTSSPHCTHIVLCSYPLKLGGQKFGKVKAEFSLNFVPNFKISVFTGKELGKIWGKKYFFEYLSKMCHLKPKNLLWV